MRMTLSTRKKVLIGAGGVLGVLIVALLLAPVFLDLNQYKPQIAAEVKKATGRELVISGPASLSLLPLPTVSLAGVKFLNAPGAQNPTMVEVKSVTVKPALWALLVVCALVMLVLRARHLPPTERAMQAPDAFGLGLFAASGTQIALDASMPSIVAVLMGTVTAAFGGVLRDVVCN